MIEKVNPAHPDKIADRIAGAIVDLAYKADREPRVAVEVLIGHGDCHVIVETSVDLDLYEIESAIYRIAGSVSPDIQIVSQDKHLQDNQSKGIVCGDNGIFRGMPLTGEQREISSVARALYEKFGTDGKYILDGDKLIICQSCATQDEIFDFLFDSGKVYFPEDYNNMNVIINPIGDWTGGTDVDTGVTNRKIGSDLASSITGGGIAGKDCSKADVSVTIHAFLKAQKTGKPVCLSCAIGDEYVDNLPYRYIAEGAMRFIRSLGGFEKLAEWGVY